MRVHMQKEVSFFRSVGVFDVIMLVRMLLNFLAPEFYI